jgi:hypothetical protein
MATYQPAYLNLVTELYKAVNTGKLLDVSNLNPDGTGAVIIPLSETIYSVKNRVAWFPVVSNNYVKYKLAMDIMGPQYEFYAADYLKLFGPITHYEGLQKEEQLMTGRYRAKQEKPEALLSADEKRQRYLNSMSRFVYIPDYLLRRRAARKGLPNGWENSAEAYSIKNDVLWPPYGEKAVERGIVSEQERALMEQEDEIVRNDFMHLYDRGALSIADYSQVGSQRYVILPIDWNSTGNVLVSKVVNDEGLNRILESMEQEREQARALASQMNGMRI